MIQKFPSWGESDQSWHGGQVLPAGCPDLDCTRTKPCSSPTQCWNPGHYSTLVAQLIRPVKMRRAPRTAALWPVLFSHKCQWLSFENWFFICCNPLTRRELGTAWSRGFCPDPRGWQCKIMLSRLKHFQTTYVLIWRCGFYKGCFPFPESTLFWRTPSQKKNSTCNS